jgi:hypothetical protein
VERYLGRRQFYDLLSLCEAAINPIRFTREVVSNDASLILSLLGKVKTVKTAAGQHDASRRPQTT